MNKDNTCVLLNMTDTCKELGFGAGKQESVEARLEKLGIYPIARVKGTRDGEEVHRPLYHSSVIVAYKAAVEHTRKSGGIDMMDIEERLARLENKSK